MAENWVLENQRERGDVHYLYNPVSDRYAPKNNDVRQWLTAYTVAHMALDEPGLMTVHRRNLEYLLSAQYRENEQGHGYILRNGRSKLGGNGLALRALARSPLHAEFADQAERLAAGVVASMADDGSFQAWFVAPPNPRGEKYQQYLLTFYSGEALIGLLEYAELRDRPAYRDAAIRAQEYYIDRYVTHLDEHYFPAYVPWHTLSLSHLFRITGEPRYADAVFALNDKLLEMLDRTTFVGRFYNPATPQYGRPHASSDAVYTESLAYALATARRAGDKVREQRYREALELALDNLIGHQYQHADSRYPGPSERYLGGFRTNVKSPWIRVDNTSHAADALRGVQEALALEL